MDKGIISVWMRKNFFLLWKKIVVDVETRQSWRDKKRCVSGGMKGLSKSYNPHMPRRINSCQGKLGCCFRNDLCQLLGNSTVLPARTDADITATLERMRNHERDLDVQEMIESFNKLTLNNLTQDTVIDQCEGVALSPDDVRERLNNENNSDKVEGMVCGEMDDMYQVDNSSSEK